MWVDTETFVPEHAVDEFDNPVPPGLLGGSRWFLSKPILAVPNRL